MSGGQESGIVKLSKFEHHACQVIYLYILLCAEGQYLDLRCKMCLHKTLVQGYNLKRWIANQ